MLPLHSSLPPEEQRRVFDRPPPGVRKVVLTTNIAETAITVDDVAYVIDTGRMKEKRFDPARRMESLEDVLVSRANAKQRRGEWDHTSTSSRCSPSEWYPSTPAHTLYPAYTAHPAYPAYSIYPAKGRAGRCRPGVAFHLLTSHAHDTIAEDQQAHHAYHGYT